jgi:hypothetical protein
MDGHYSPPCLSVFIMCVFIYAFKVLYHPHREGSFRSLLTENMVYMLHPIREISQFMNWADLYVAFEDRLLASSYFCPVHELGRK